MWRPPDEIPRLNPAEEKRREIVDGTRQVAKNFGDRNYIVVNFMSLHSKEAAE